MPANNHKTAMGCSEAAAQADDLSICHGIQQGNRRIKSNLKSRNIYRIKTTAKSTATTTRAAATADAQWAYNNIIIITIIQTTTIQTKETSHASLCLSQSTPSGSRLYAGGAVLQLFGHLDHAGRRHDSSRRARHDSTSHLGHQRGIRRGILCPMVRRGKFQAAVLDQTVGRLGYRCRVDPRIWRHHRHDNAVTAQFVATTAIQQPQRQQPQQHQRDTTTTTRPARHCRHGGNRKSLAAPNPPIAPRLDRHDHLWQLFGGPGIGNNDDDDQTSSVRPYQLQLARVLLSILTLLSVASGLIYTAEHDVNPQLQSYYSALYFGLTTLTTVGFGDITPVTNAGRLVVGVSILAGVAIIPAQAANLVEALLEYDRDRNRRGPRVTIRPETFRSSAQKEGGGGGGAKPISSVSLRNQAGKDGDGNGGDGGNVGWMGKCCLSCHNTDHRQDAQYCWSCGAKL